MTRPTQRNTQNSSQEMPRRQRLFTLVMLLAVVSGFATSARAGGNPPLSAADQDLYCTLVAENTYGAERWDAEPTAELTHADSVLVVIEAHLCMARFDVALTEVRDARESFMELVEDWESDRRRARLEVLAATAKIALDRTEAARLNFRWALEIDPYLDLDAERTSPKVMRIFRESQQSQVAAR